MERVMDIVERLRKIDKDNIADLFVGTGGDLESPFKQAADEIKRLREALQKIADLEHEDLPAPKSANETVLWVCLDRCVTLAENALKEKE